MTRLQHYMLAVRVLWPAAVGFVLGALIVFWIAGTELDQVETILALVSAGIGAGAGLMASLAMRSERPCSVWIMIGGGAVACALVALVILAYRWIIG